MVKVTMEHVFAPEPDHVYFLGNPDGSVTRHEAEPAPRNHQAYSLRTVVDFAVEHGRPTTQGEEAIYPAIWFSSGAVVCLLDDATRRDRVTYHPKHTHEVLTAARLADCGWWDRESFLSVLRIDFKGCLAGGSLITALESHTPLPEEQNLFLRPWIGLLKDLVLCVKCYVESRMVVHGATGGLTTEYRMVPYPGQLAEACYEAEVALGAYLRDVVEREGGSEYVLIYHGSPE